MDFRSDAFTKLVSSVPPDGSQLAATLFLLRTNRQDLELVERICRFWSGDAMPLPEIKRALSIQPAGLQFAPRASRAAELATEKMSFAVSLMRAAGYRGW